MKSLVKSVTPPKRLSPEARRWWSKLVKEFTIDDQHGLWLLELACEAFDRMREAQDAIKRDGAVCKDRFGQLRPHPSVLIERDSRTSLQRCLRALNLDIQPPNHGEVNF